MLPPNPQFGAMVSNAVGDFSLAQAANRTGNRLSVMTISRLRRGFRCGERTAHIFFEAFRRELAVQMSDVPEEERAAIFIRTATGLGADLSIPDEVNLLRDILATLLRLEAKLDCVIGQTEGGAE